MTVDFLVIGAQKSGTRALRSTLLQHPQICFCQKREAHFFDDEASFDGAAPDYSPYHALFDRGPDHRVTGESTPAYLFWRPAPERAACSIQPSRSSASRVASAAAQASGLPP